MVQNADNKNRFYFYRLLIILGLAAGVWALWRLSTLWLLAFGAILLAIVLRAIASPLERHFSWSSRWALAAAVFLIGLVIVLVVWLAGHAIGNQVDAFEQQIPEAWSRIRTWLQGSQIGSRAISAIENSAGEAVSKLPKATAAVLDSLIDVALVLFVGVYLAIRPAFYVEGALKLLPKSIRGESANLLDLCGRALRLWMTGQLIAMGVIGLLITLGLWLIGLPSALALGVIAGLAEFIPVAGLFFATVLSLLLALAQGIDSALETLAVFAIVQQVESNIVMPMVQQQMVMLAPAITLLSLMGFSLLFGPLGVLVAIPLTVVACVFIKQLYMRETLGEATSVPGEKR